MSGNIDPFERDPRWEQEREAELLCEEECQDTPDEEINTDDYNPADFDDFDEDESDFVRVESIFEVAKRKLSEEGFDPLGNGAPVLTPESIETHDGRLIEAGIVRVMEAVKLNDRVPILLDYDRTTGLIHFKDKPGSTPKEVRLEAQRIRIREEARALVAAEQSTASLQTHPLEIYTLKELGELPDEPEARIQALIPWNASTYVNAQRKTGKTTFALNLARALLTGNQFLDHFEVRPVTGTVAYLNYELPRVMFTRWANDVGIDQDRLIVLNLRGKPNPLGGDEARAKALAAELKARNVETIIVDPFAVAYPGETENDANQVRKWLDMVNGWAREQAGALDLIVIDHMGKMGESARGSSAKEDWADSIIYLVSGSGDDEGTRYMKAIGRDVDFSEDALAYDPETRRLTLTGTGSRTAGSQARALANMTDKVRDYFTTHPGEELSGYALAKELGGRSGLAVRAAQELSKRGVLSERAGARNARLFSLREDKNSDLSPPIPTSPRDMSSTYPHLSYKGEVEVDRSNTSPIPAQNKDVTK